MVLYIFQYFSFDREEESVSIVKFYELYRAPMQGWINMSKYKAMRRIKKAVDLDMVRRSSREQIPHQSLS